MNIATQIASLDFSVYPNFYFRALFTIWGRMNTSFYNYLWYQYLTLLWSILTFLNQLGF